MDPKSTMLPAKTPAPRSLVQYHSLSVQSLIMHSTVRSIYLHKVLDWAVGMQDVYDLRRVRHPLPLFVGQTLTTDLHKQLLLKAR